MDKSRFSLLLLEPGEIYFEDFSAIFIPPDITSSTYDTKAQDGRLKMCSKSLVFDPKDITKPIIKIPLKTCIIIEEWKGKSKFLKSKNVLNVNCKEYIEMLEGNITVPYKFKAAANFLFVLNYAKIQDCLTMILQLQRASTLPSVEQSNMIAVIVYSRHSRVAFDPLWLDLHEKIIIEMQADKVCPLIVNPGRVVLSTAKLYFQPYNNIETSLVIKINLKNIKEIVKRRFLLRHIGLEIYSTDSVNSHIYLSFRNKGERDDFYNKLLFQPELQLNNLEQNAITLQWQNGIISNYEYLLYVNSLGDRTCNDLTQYPVFPWIITDYSSQTLDLTDEKIYRDLSKPIGALNPERLKRLLERYHEMGQPKFIYGSHFSTPGFVLYYLARLFPHYVLCLQGGRFDHPDRMFNSVNDAYRNCFSNMSDFKELIPEFYNVCDEGAFLVNNLGINFGLRHNNLKVGDVELPPWAESPKHFVETLNAALESDIVSRNLHNWIDLIFGYKQKGEEAITANNLFYHLCYEGNVDLESILDLNERHAIEVQIMEYGQIPKQVFTVPHPKRKIGLPLLTEPYQIKQHEEFLEDIWRNANDLELVTSFNSHKTTISHIYISTDCTKVVSVGHDSKLKMFCLSQNRQTRSASIGDMPLSCCIPLPNANTIIIGSWDNQILLYDFDYGRVTVSALAHEDTVTCMALGETSQLLVSGSTDSSIKIWKNLDNNVRDLVVNCLHKHLDHNSAVNCVCFDCDDQHIAVGTDDGELYIWRTSNFDLVKKFNTLNKINAINYSKDGQKVAVGQENGCFQILEVSTGMPVFNKNMKSSILSLKWQDHLLAIGCGDGTLSLWDMFEARVLLEKQAHSGGVSTVDISKDKSIIATGSQDKIIKVWRPKTDVPES